MTLPMPEESSPVMTRFENTRQHQEQQHQHQHQQQCSEPLGNKLVNPLHSPFLRSSPATTLPQVVLRSPQQLLPRDSHNESDHSPKATDKGFWTGPAKITTVVNGLIFRSNFDSGNLVKVVMPAEQGGSGGVYLLWTAR